MKCYPAQGPVLELLTKASWLVHHYRSLGLGVVPSPTGFNELAHQKWTVSGASRSSFLAWDEVAAMAVRS